MLWRPNKKGRALYEKKENEISISDEELRESTAPRNEYYASISAIYNAAKYITLVVLVLFICVSLISNPETVTYDNFMFLMKDITNVFDSTSNVYGDISYTPEVGITHSAYRKNLAVASVGGVDIYNGDGELTYTGNEKFSNPRIESSDKYMLVYDFGYQRYALYNLFAKIYSENLDGEIVIGDISDCGMYALITKSKEYNFSASVYTKNCRLKNRILTDDYILDIDIDSSGDRFAILSTYAADGGYVGKVTFYEVGKNEAMTSIKLNESLPIKCCYLEDGGLSVLCDNGVYYYDEDGSFVKSYSFGSGQPILFDMNENGISFVHSTSGSSIGNQVIFVGADGEIRHQSVCDGRIVAVRECDGFLFVLTDSAVMRIDIDGDEIKKLDALGMGKELIVISRYDVMLATDSKCEYYDFSK